jgi:hypothetical protein
MNIEKLAKELGKVYKEDPALAFQGAIDELVRTAKFLKSKKQIEEYLEWREKEIQREKSRA